MDNINSQLAEFGFNQKKIKKAIKHIKDKNNIQEALDWLDKHADDLLSSSSDVSEEKSFQKEDAENGIEAPLSSSNKEERDEENSSKPTALKCNTCNKLFKSVDFAQLHATKTGHDDFSESTEQRPDLTAEEKAQKLAELRDLLSEKRKSKEKEDFDDKVKGELMRRKVGKESLQQKRDLKDKERLRYLEQQKKDQEKEKELREKIKRQIQEDREHMKEKLEREKERSLSNPDSSFVLSPISPSDEQNSLPSQSILHSNMIRMTDGKSVYLELDSDTKLKDLYAKARESNSHARLYIPFPRTLLDDKNDSEKTLDELGLCPSVALVLQ